MRYLIALAFCFLLAPLQVHACLGPDSNYDLFFKTIPNPQPDADLIAEVALSDVNEKTQKATATATILQVLKTSDARVQQGKKISMQYTFTSCGPDLVDGARGTIIAKVGADSKGRLVLYPYTHRSRRGGQIMPPYIPDGKAR